MKRLVILGLAALLVLGMGVFALGTDATLNITEGCIVEGQGTFGEWDPGAGDPDAMETYYSAAEATGQANYDMCVTVTINQILTNGDYTLDTSLHVDGGSDIDHAVNGDSITAPVLFVDGSWSLGFAVDVHRNGYADHAGSYTATVTVTCGPC